MIADVLGVQIGACFEFMKHVYIVPDEQGFKTTDGVTRINFIKNNAVTPIYVGEHFTCIYHRPPEDSRKAEAQEIADALKEIGIIQEPEKEIPGIEDLSEGYDARGDHALFIERRHINGWNLDEEAKAVTGSGTHFFRMLNNGEQTSTHGWIEGGKIVQYG